MNCSKGFFCDCTFPNQLKIMTRLVLDLWRLALAAILVTCLPVKGQECGDNPIKQVLLVAKRTGRTLSHVLTLLKEIDNPAYENLARKFRTYAACVGLVDTGYFRKRSSMDIRALTPMDDAENEAGDDARQYRPRYGYNEDTEEPVMFEGVAQSFSKTYPTQDIAESSYFPTSMQLIESRSKKSDESLTSDQERQLSVDRLKKWLYGPYRNYMNSYYIRWNLLWPLTKKNE